MTRDEVLSMARKVKLGAALDFDYRGSFGAMTAPEQDRLVQLEQFAALVAAREREACEADCESVVSDSNSLAEHPLVTAFGKDINRAMAMGAKNCLSAIRARAIKEKNT